MPSMSSHTHIVPPYGPAWGGTKHSWSCHRLARGRQKVLPSWGKQTLLFACGHTAQQSQGLWQQWHRQLWDMLFTITMRAREGFWNEGAANLQALGS